MNPVAAIGGPRSSAGLFQAGGGAGDFPEVAGPTPAVWPEDQVEIAGLTVSEAIVKVAEARLSAIRQQIAAGAYLSENKLNTVADRILEMLRAEASERSAES